MSENPREIGSEGLEQGGPSLGNDYARSDLSIGNAGDALANANPLVPKEKDDENLAIDQESSRNLSPDADDTEADGTELIDDDFDDEEEDEDFDEAEDVDDDSDEENILEGGI
ncbi:MAG: hypothetical protein ABI151_10010 [Chitinophagaceae bacterium]